MAEVIRLHYIVKRVEDLYIADVVKNFKESCTAAIRHTKNCLCTVLLAERLQRKTRTVPTLRQHQVVTTDISEDAALASTSLPTAPHGLFNNAVSAGTS